MWYVVCGMWGQANRPAFRGGREQGGSGADLQLPSPYS